VSGSTKAGAAITKAQVEASGTTWLVAMKRNGKSLSAGEDGPLLLLQHEDAAIAPVTTRWVNGLFYIEAK
jgi:hypothetical protein